eukprot:811650-Rhodomonas_salina.2
MSGPLSLRVLSLPMSGVHAACAVLSVGYLLLCALARGDVLRAPGDCERAMSSTDVAYGGSAIGLRACYAMSGTDERMVLPGTAGAGLVRAEGAER